MKKTVRSIIAAGVAATTLAACGSSSSTASSEPIKIAIPDDATNGGRAIKLLETAGFIEVDADAGYAPELADITGYNYNIEIVPQAANTLTSVLADYGAAIINNTFAVPYGLDATRDGLIVEDQGDGDNPYINVIVARTSEADNEDYKKIVEAYQTDYVAAYQLTKFPSSSLPVFEYSESYVAENGAAIVEEVDEYKNTITSEGKKTVRIGICGTGDTWYSVQKVLDEQDAGIYLEIVEFSAYTLPNDALNSGDIELNSFQHIAYLNSEIEAYGYELTPIGDTVIAPFAIYSEQFETLDALKEAAGTVE